MDLAQSSQFTNGFSSELQKQQTLGKGVEVVDLETDDPHDQDTLGFRLSGSRSVGVFIKSIHLGSPADLIGKIRAGDQLLQVNEIILSGMTPDQVVRILRSALAYSGRVSVTVAHTGAERPKSHFGFMSPSMSDGHLAKLYSPSNNTAPDGPPTPPALPVKSQKTKTSTKRVNNVTRHEAEVHRGFSSRSKVSPEFLPSATTVDCGMASDDSTTTITDEAVASISDYKSVTPLSPLDPLFGTLPNRVEQKPPFSSHSRKISLGRTMSSKGRHRAWETEDYNLNVPCMAGSTDEREPRNERKARSFGPEEVKHLIPHRKSSRKQMSTEELPLVSFDQLSQLTSSPTEMKRNDDRGDSSQSKSSKSSGASNRSSQSQQMSWHCPVCLDGASRIRRTKRRMMSTVCGHVFCSKCVEDVINKYRMCPTCRTAVSGLSEVHPIFM